MVYLAYGICADFLFSVFGVYWNCHLEKGVKYKSIFTHVAMSVYKVKSSLFSYGVN